MAFLRTSFNAALLLFGLSVPTQANDCGTTTISRCTISEHAYFDSQGFADTVTDALGQRFVGYGVVLVDHEGEPIVQLARGEATKATDPEGSQLFEADTTKARLGSVSKVLTASVALRVIQETSSVSVATPIADILPDFLASRLGTRYSAVTLADLMRHTSGLPRDADERQLWQLVADGLSDTAPVGS